MIDPWAGLGYVLTTLRVAPLTLVKAHVAAAGAAQAKADQAAKECVKLDPRVQETLNNSAKTPQ
jgi:hypothetical protein